MNDDEKGMLIGLLLVVLFVMSSIGVAIFIWICSPY